MTKYNLLFIALILILLLIDVAQFFLLGTHIIPLLFCMYIALLSLPIKCQTLVFIGLLQCLESFCFYNFFSLPFIYLIPITILGIYLKKHLYPSLIHPIIFACIGTLIQIYIIEGSSLLTNLASYYTIMQISAIISITICFSLTLNKWGMLDNRS